MKRAAMSDFSSGRRREAERRGMGSTHFDLFLGDHKEVIRISLRLTIEKNYELDSGIGGLEAKHLVDLFVSSLVSSAGCIDPDELCLLTDCTQLSFCTWCIW